MLIKQSLASLSHLPSRYATVFPTGFVVSVLYCSGSEFWTAVLKSMALTLGTLSAPQFPILGFQHRLKGSQQSMELLGVACLWEGDTVHESERAGSTTFPSETEEVKTGGRNWQGSLGVRAMKTKSFISILGQK